MQPQAASQPSRLVEPRDGVDIRLGQLLQLVDHDDQPRHPRWVTRSSPDVLFVTFYAGIPECRLTPDQLGLYGIERPLHESSVEITDEAETMGEMGAVVKGAPTLEVDQQKRQRVGACRGGHGCHEGLQKRAFARTGHAGKEDMRTVANQVNRERSLVGHAHDGGQTIRRRLTPPSLEQGFGGWGLESEQFEMVDFSRELLRSRRARRDPRTVGPKRGQLGRRRSRRHRRGGRHPVHHCRSSGTG